MNRSALNPFLETGGPDVFAPRVSAAREDTVTELQIELEVVADDEPSLVELDAELLVEQPPPVVRSRDDEITEADSFPPRSALPPPCPPPVVVRSLPPPSLPPVRALPPPAAPPPRRPSTAPAPSALPPPRAPSLPAWPAATQRRSAAPLREDITREHSVLPLRPQPAPARRRSEPSRPSAPPVAFSMPPAPSPRLGFTPTARAVSIAVGATLGALAFILTWHSAAPASAPPQAEVAVSVTAGDGTAVRQARVMVDGLPYCDVTPCRIALLPGTHQVDVTSDKSGAKGVRTLELRDGERTTLHFSLPNDAPPAAPSTAAAPEGIPVLRAPDLPLEAAPQPTTARAPTAGATFASRPAPARPAFTGAGAKLNLNSIPISNVVIDGRPVGSTPLIGVPVSAGTRSVTFVHPELGRRSATVKLDAGQHRAVVVRFD
ncbi:MAG: PEGA domain-containing protein [Polyangiaceae bacterium]|nr:PEGA domain-containing protein [Polyangiaceae bacterium]